MSPELILQKIGLALLLVSMIMGAVVGWRARSTDVWERIITTFMYSLIPLCGGAAIALIILVLYQALFFIFVFS